MNNLLCFLFFCWAIVATFLLSLLFYNTQLPRYEYCEGIGFKNLGEKETMQQKIDLEKNQIKQIEFRIAKTISESDKNQNELKNIIESVFLIEKIKNDYNTFAYDLNVCQRYCK